MGTGPCHLVLDKERRNLLVANYGSGSVAVLPVAMDGRLGEASDVKQHTGHSVNPRRQEGPHAHCVTFDPAGRFTKSGRKQIFLDKIFLLLAAPPQLGPYLLGSGIQKTL